MITILGLDPQQFFGGLLLGGVAIYYATKLILPRLQRAKIPPERTTEADFAALLAQLKSSYSAATAENKHLSSELDAIRKVVGDPLPTPTPAKPRAKK